MRILVAHNVPRARNGGMSRLQGLIHDEIERLGGAQVEYFCSDDVPAAQQASGRRFQFPYQVWRRAREGKFDIVNVHEPAGAIVSLLKRRAKVVVTSHGVEQRAWEVLRENTQQRPPLATLVQARIAFTLADHIFCLNEQDRGFLQSRFHIPGGRITRIFPAAGPEYSIEDRDYSRFRRILFAGTWLERKGKQDAVDAFGLLPSHFEFATLGAGVPAAEVLASFPEEFRPRVKVFEPRNDHDISRAMAESDLFLLPSLFEGTPLTIMEAMRSGLPIVTTDTCGMRDVIQHERNGFLVPVRSPERIAAAIVRLENDPPLRQKLGRAAHREAVEKYTWHKSAETVWDVYRRL
jgi:glycosyltransferase involved in cell wall biosynthesis